MDYLPKLTPANVRMGVLIMGSLLAYQLIAVPTISRLSPRAAQRLN